MNIKRNTSSSRDNDLCSVIESPLMISAEMVEAGVLVLRESGLLFHATCADYAVVRQIQQVAASLLASDIERLRELPTST